MFKILCFAKFQLETQKLLVMSISFMKMYTKYRAAAPSDFLTREHQRTEEGI